MKQPPIKTKELSGSTVQIADGQNWEIASITAYGENAHGGTTEAPVALTGISSVTVNDDVTELPIPRPLRRVGDVKDKCVTRQEHEGVEKLVVTYNVGFVELDGTEDVTFHDYGNGKRLFLDLSRSAFGQYSLGQHRTIAEASAVESPIRQETIGFPAHFFARAHNFKPPGRACQPEADSPMRT